MPYKLGMLRLLFILLPNFYAADSLIKVWPLPVSTTTLIVLLLTNKLMVGKVCPSVSHTQLARGPRKLLFLCQKPCFLQSEQVPCGGFCQHSVKVCVFD